jgi:hypothetical protein
MTPAAQAVHAIERLLQLRPSHDARAARDATLLTGWWRAAGITSFGLGSKQVGSFDALEVRIAVKRPLRSVPTRCRIPARVRFDSLELDVPTDVVAGKVHLCAHASNPIVRPVQPGAAVSIITGSTGTLGAFVKDTQNNVFLLSCSHVIARSGQLVAPFPSLSPQQKKIQQPIDPDAAANTIATLTSQFSSLVRQDSGVNTEDMALAAIDPGVAISPLQRSNGKAMFNPPTAPIETGTRTTLLGTNTPSSSGVVTNALLTKSWVVHDVPFIGDAVYKNVILYSTNCVEGDSGGAVIDDSGRLLGIHVGGSSLAGVGVFYPIASYLATRGLSVVNQ